jgi:hypothetical protein
LKLELIKNRNKMKKFNIIVIISALFLATSTAQANIFSDIASGESVQDPFSKDDKACFHLSCSAADKKVRDKRKWKKNAGKRARLAKEAKMRKWILEHPRAYHNRIQQERGLIGRTRDANERNRKSKVQAIQDKSRKRKIAQFKIKEEKRKKRLKDTLEKEKKLLLQEQTIADMKQKIKIITEKNKAAQTELNNRNKR